MPSVDIDTDILNQYNRKRVSQTRLQFKPMTLTFHDVADGKTLRFWEMYYEFYFKDGLDKLQADYSSRGDNKIKQAEFFDGVYGNKYGKDPFENFGYNLTNQVNDRRKFSGSRKTPELEAITSDKVDKLKYLIDSIDIVQHRGHAAKKTTIVHPRIESFNHDTLMYSGVSDLVEMSMTFVYEDVIYSDTRFTPNDYDVYGKVRGKFKDSPHTPPNETTKAGEKGLLSVLFDTDLNIPIPPDSPILGAGIGAINSATSNVQQGTKSYVADVPRQASRAAGDSIFTGEIKNPIDPKRAAGGILKTTTTSSIGGITKSFSSTAKSKDTAYKDTERVSK